MPGELKSDTSAPSNSLPLLAATLRLRLRLGPARAPRALPLPPLPLPFPVVAPTEPPLRPLPRLAAGRGGTSTSSPSLEEEDSSCGLLVPLLLFFDLPSLRCCSRKSLTTCCNRLLAYALRFRGAITPPVELTPKNSFKLPCLLSACAYRRARGALKSLIHPVAKEGARRHTWLRFCIFWIIGNRSSSTLDWLHPSSCKNKLRVWLAPISLLLGCAYSRSPSRSGSPHLNGSSDLSTVGL